MLIDPHRLTPLVREYMPTLNRQEQELLAKKLAKIAESEIYSHLQAWTHGTVPSAREPNRTTGKLIFLRKYLSS